LWTRQKGGKSGAHDTTMGKKRRKRRKGKALCITNREISSEGKVRDVPCLNEKGRKKKEKAKGR